MKDAPFRSSHHVGSSRAGVSDARRVPCSFSPENHGVHPENEPCPYCAPPLAASREVELDEPLDDLDFQNYFWP